MKQLNIWWHQIVRGHRTKGPWPSLALGDRWKVSSCECGSTWAQRRYVRANIDHRRDQP